MDDEFLLAPMPAQADGALRELRESLPLCERYGLPLSEAEMEDLVECRGRALADAGRVEFGGGVLPKLIRAFCASPYAERDTWAETLAGLQEAFYYFKSEAEERLTDDELIGFMARVFDGRAQGSAEYLAGTSLEELCRYVRENWEADDAESAGDLF
jgi:hypothetical protein